MLCGQVDIEGWGCYIYLMNKLGLKATAYKDTNHVKQLGATLLTATPQTPIPPTSAFNQQIPDYEAPRTTSTLPPQSTASKPTNPTPQTMPNRPTRSTTTTREPNPSEPYRGEIAQKFDLEAYSLSQTYQTRSREFEQVRVQDLDIGGHGESSGPGIWCRCAQCSPEEDVHEAEHASSDKLGLFFFIVLLYPEGIFKVVRTIVRVLGAGLKWAGLWAWKY
ncbi:hypothetical protein DID88_004401 [Monilinia fructigena]|uniref:Uncharacterized protein n=1 Tax=Monilinia fructigena TaxID=38457 RepID=A0A395IQH9_9HELO|nr:hypothetical protein DID88_004401 [Monilinia fructigena]